MIDRISQRVRAHPIRTAVVVALLAASPTLLLPLTSDDFLHHLALQAYWDDDAALEIYGEAVDKTGFVNVYSFLDGDIERTDRHRRNSRVPWWTLDEIRINFYRPLSSAALSLDYHLWPLWAPGYRLHSLLWWGVLVLLFGLILRRVGGGSSLFALAILLFAITEKHFLPLAWAANRHAIVASVPAAFGLWAHLRWRQDRWRAGAFLAPLGQALGLLGGETALGFFGFYLAYEVWGARPRKLRFVLPVVGVIVAWAAFYAGSGYGTFGSGYYINPASEPLRYLGAVVARAPVLMLGQFGGILSGLWFGVKLRPLLFVLGVITIAVVGLVLRHAWPHLSDDERHTSRWLGLGGLLAIAPSLSAQPADRLLLVAELGFAWILAVLIRHCWRQRATNRLLGVYGYALGLRHLMVAAGGWIFATTLIGVGNARSTRATHEVEFPADVATRSAGLFVVSDPALSVYLPSRRLLRDQEIPERWYVWSMAPRDHRLTRVSETQLELTCLEGGMLEPSFAQLFRSHEHPLVVGDVIELGGHRVRVSELQDGRVRSIVIELNTPPGPENPWLFMTQRAGTLQDLELPAVGESIELPFTRGPLGL